MTKPKDPGLFFSTQYFRPPCPPKEDWERDLRQIKDCGFDAIKVSAPWNWVEPQPGDLRIEEVRELLDLAQSIGLRVIVSACVNETCPHWLVQRLPEARYVSADGVPVDLLALPGIPSGGAPGMCWDHPEYKTLGEQYFRRLIQALRDHSALFGWEIWEEPLMPPIAIPSDTFSGGLYCYCPSSLDAFHGWLAGRYATIEALNEAWYARYGSFDQVMPPRKPGGFPAMMDWLRFWQEHLAQWLSDRAELFRREDPAHPAISHNGPDGLFGPYKTYTDEWQYAQAVDIWGCSWFPRVNDSDLCEAALHIDICRSSAQGRPCWIAEIQGGGGDTDRSIFIHTVPTPREVAAWNWLAVGHGFRTIQYWQYRPELLGPEAPGYGLCAEDGRSTDRLEAAARVINVVKAHPLFHEAVPDPAEVGVVHIKDAHNLVFCGGPSASDPLEPSIAGIYRALWEANIPADFVDLRFVQPDELARYRALFCPIPLCMGDEEARKLQDYVANGGCLISEAKPAAFTPMGYHRPRTPGAGLEEVFGAQACPGEAVAECEIRMGHQLLLGREYREVYAPTSGCVRGAFSDGCPAVIENTLGRGRTWLLGSLIFADRRNAGALLGLLPPEVEPSVRVTPKVFARRLRAEGAEALIVINTGPQVAAISLQVASAGPWTDAWGGQTAEAEAGCLRFTLDPLECAVWVFAGEAGR